VRDNLARHARRLKKIAMKEDLDEQLRVKKMLTEQEHEVDTWINRRAVRRMNRKIASETQNQTTAN
jgi:hypothetical protein